MYDKKIQDKALTEGLKNYPKKVIGHRKTLFEQNAPIDENEDKRVLFMHGYMESPQEYESLSKIHGWVARDRSGILKIHECKPYRNENCGIWDNMDTRIIIPRSLFPEITWESEPVEVELLVRRV